MVLFAGGDPGGSAGRAAPGVPGACGFVSPPHAERWGNYVPSIIPRRYDAFLFIDETRALDPLHLPVLVDGEPPETFPSGM
jgi:hypothetical protein